MSTAYDLTASVSLPELDDATGAANDAGPLTCPWSTPCASVGRGQDGCDPPVPTRAAPDASGACSGVGETDTEVASGPRTPAGEPYSGNLLADILEYRRLRAQVLGGGGLPEGRERRYEHLQGLLCLDESRERGHGRAYTRYDIRVPAVLRVSSGRGVTEMQVGVDNISAGGVKLAGAKARAEGERVELVMDAGDGRSVVLPARVAWMRGHAVGLMFAGAARWR